MKKITLLTLAFWLSFSQGGFAETFTAKMTYPSPRASHNSIRFYKQGCPLALPCTDGTVMTDCNGELSYCNNNVWESLAGVWTQAGDLIYLTDITTPAAKKVGIGTSTPAFKLHLQNNGGIIAEGVFGGASDDVLTLAGAGTRLMWYPKKAAWRAGTVSSSQWDDASIGNNSVAMGTSTTASGAQSTVSGGSLNGATQTGAFVGGGYNNQATQTYATISGGFRNTASGNRATIGGGGSNSVMTAGHTASGNFSTISGGERNTASNTYATVAGGILNTASGQYATVSGGYNNQATGDYSVVGGGGNSLLALTNQTSGSFSVIAGGYDNEIISGSSTISGGSANWINNNVNDIYGTIGGGTNNAIFAKGAAIGGGEDNDAGDAVSADPLIGSYATVAGGINNYAQGTKSIVGGGEAKLQAVAMLNRKSVQASIVDGIVKNILLETLL